MKRRKRLRRGPTPEQREWWMGRRTAAYNRDAGTCQWCGKVQLSFFKTQTAHIHSLRAGRSRYEAQTCSICGTELNELKNLATVCSNECNDAIAKDFDERMGCRKRG